MNSHLEIIQLILAYTLTGAVIFTVVTTCASLVGWIKFADPKQQNKLFYLLVVELVTVAVASIHKSSNLIQLRLEKTLQRKQPRRC